MSFFPRQLIVCLSQYHSLRNPFLTLTGLKCHFYHLFCFSMFIYGLYSWSVCNSGTVLYCCNSVTSSLPQECPRFAGACFCLGSITDYYCYFFCCSNCLALLLQNSSFQMGPVRFHLTLTLCCDRYSFWGHGMPPGPLVVLCPSPRTCLWLTEVALLWGLAVKGARKSMWEASVRYFCVPHGRSCQNWDSDLLEKQMCQLTHSACVLFSPPHPPVLVFNQDSFPKFLVNFFVLHPLRWGLLRWGSKVTLSPSVFHLGFSPPPGWFFRTLPVSRFPPRGSHGAGSTAPRAPPELHACPASRAAPGRSDPPLHPLVPDPWPAFSRTAIFTQKNAFQMHPYCCTKQ